MNGYVWVYVPIVELPNGDLSAVYPQLPSNCLTLSD